MKMTRRKRIVAYSIYVVCLVWTAYVILATVLDLPDEAILRDVGIYLERLMENMRELPFYLFAVLYLASILPRLLSRAPGGCVRGVQFVPVGRAGLVLGCLLAFSIAWYGLYGACIQETLERILLVPCTGDILSPSAACIGRMRGLNRLEGVVECILPWIAPFRLDRPLIGMTIALLVFYSLFVYNYMFSLWEV